MLTKYNDTKFKFADEFTCSVRHGIVYVEEYNEGEFPLLHIKCEADYLVLFGILTGRDFDEIKLS